MPDLPDYQKRLIEDLKDRSRTMGLRALLSRYRFSEDECGRIRKDAERYYVLKRSERSREEVF